MTGEQVLQPSDDVLVEAPRHDADTIADALGRPRPTPQQRAVIESPLAPALVVAGAGSGKTETMASRVVWLLANGMVRPDGILGLTFTRKAAGELSVRINDRIRALEDVGLLDAGDAFEAPTVSTYNAFANSVFRENALLVGRDGESQVLTEPSAWQLARRVVVAARDDRLAGLDRDVDTVTAAVVALAGAVSEHLVEPERLRRFAIEFAGLLELPGNNRGAPYKAITDAVAAIGALEPLVDLVEEFRRQKVDRGFVEFSDQIALALAAAESAPRVVTDLRQRYGVVLLDEYQDTSVVQTRFLARLFRGHPVMAVGDPHQSIYGFRGASAANLARFPRDFGSDGEQPVTFALSTSWRNPVDVLAGANAVVAPLSEASEVDVERLEPRPGADAGTVRAVFPETLPEEAAAVARWFADRRAADPKGSMALLLRSRKDLAAFTGALGDHRVPYHVLGTGGLLQRPEIVDLVACLRVLHDPAAGNDLIRVLAGARWRIGAADIAALHALARWLFGRDHTQQRLDDDLTAAFRASVAAGEHGSIVDALDFVATAPDEHGALADISDVGRRRMRELGKQLAALRARAGGDLVDFVTLVVQEMRLDIEVAAHEQGSGAFLDAFVDELAGFVTTDDRADLGAFLGWIDAAARRDDMGPRSEEPEAGTVQILTIHGSKGLEWDAVAVPRMVEGGLPARPQEGSSGWIGFGRLPYEFRGDADELPRLDWRGHDSQKDVTLAIDAYKEQVKARNEDEERRLTYVALTRAKHDLLVTGSFWAGGVRPTAPSRYLHDLVEAGVVDGAAVPETTEHEENPLGDAGATQSWPHVPFGHRAARVAAAADRVRNANPGASGRFAADIDLLLAERAANRSARHTVVVPHRVPASGFKDYLSDPDTVAERLRRPMPERPYRATRLGTLFHQWVEQRARSGGSLETLDAWDGELDLDPEDVVDASAEPVVTDDDARRLADFQATFARSRWAGLTPIEVEREIHIPFLGHSVVCKLDAVYEIDGRAEVVDWKTGKAPTGSDDLAKRQLQLALYRVAYAEFTGRPLDEVDAVFYFVADDLEVRPTELLDRAGLERSWRDAIG
ncbi:DNA helicase-2 / ATP-dependent DNA helicase PcrA [Curtobacterium sp. 314Chir4.1]|uniref:ATP-dependent DNA helicase n=1 Tax=Curtobacterium sp. 314Chir4.1 TaxID=1279028 RepID=UPI000BC843F0|nr:ATP-dependent DNA helicase [Curtobacterium sp. 314Chir4.1]SOC88479.1 DNA helicase-2 / ATP-dependent DNA helicase PcrA [Curtobacterium sp. 314Chir4.1]